MNSTSDNSAVGGRAQMRTSRRVKRDAGKNRYMVLVVVFLILEFMRPQDSFLSVLAPLKTGMLFSIVMLFVLVKNLDKLDKNVVTISYLLILVQMSIWVPFATNNFHAYQTTFSMVLYAINLFAIATIIDTKDKIEFMVRGWVLVVIYIALWAITHGGNGPGGGVLDENDTCFAINSALPLCFYLAMNEDNKKKKLLWLAGLTILVTGVVATASRGGLVGFIAAVMMMLWISENRIKNIVRAAALSLVIGGVVIQALPDAYVEDMRTITDKEDDTANLRFLHWTTSWEMFKDNPVFGVGPNNYAWNSNAYFHLSPYYDPNARNRGGRQSHSMYFTLIAELGLFGTILFALILRRSIKTTLVRDKDGNLTAIQKGFLVSLLSSLVTAMFVTVIFYPIIWTLFIMINIYGRYITPVTKDASPRSRRRQGPGYARDSGPDSAPDSPLESPRGRRMQSA